MYVMEYIKKVCLTPYGDFFRTTLEQCPGTGIALVEIIRIADIEFPQEQTDSTINTFG